MAYNCVNVMSETRMLRKPREPLQAFEAEPYWNGVE